MPLLCAGLIVLALLISLPATAVVRFLSDRLKAHDSAPVPGQIKFAQRRVPNTGGVAIFLTIVLPILVGIRVIVSIDASGAGTYPSWLPASLHAQIAGIQRQSPLALL